MPDTAPSDLAANTDWFLNRIDAVERCANFVRSNRERLAATLFLDGRTAFATGPTLDVELAALDSLASAPAAPARFIFHMSFCGSTQLSHLVGESGAGVVLKEPQALVDLADWQRTLAERGIVDPRFSPALCGSIALLSRGWPGSPPTVVKPSNWANTLIPLLDGAASRVVLVTIEWRAFLRAVFRGGRDRLAFTARAAPHFAAAVGQTVRLDQALASSDDPLDRMARLILLAHDLQHRQFAQAASFPAVARIDRNLIIDNPVAALDRACDALGLSWSEEQKDADEKISGRDAKNPGRSFIARDSLPKMPVSKTIIADASTLRWHGRKKPCTSSVRSPTRRRLRRP